MPKPFLRIVEGAGKGTKMALPDSEPLVIGRRTGDLKLEDPLVSSEHAWIVPGDGTWVLKDRNSTNGTLVNNRLVKEQVLQVGMEITLGSTRMVLCQDPDDAGEDVQGSRVDGAMEIAWLLDEDAVEIPDRDHTRSPGDVIGPDLRLPPGMNAVLEVVAGDDAGKVFRFTRGNVIIGRRAGEVPLTDLEVSRRHSVIEVFGRDMIYLRDLGSTNGTYHNGRRIRVARLRTGDTVGVGRTVLKMQINR